MHIPLQNSTQRIFFSRDIMLDEVTHTLLVLHAAVSTRMCFYILIPIHDVAIFKLGCVFSCSYKYRVIKSVTNNVYFNSPYFFF